MTKEDIAIALRAFCWNCPDSTILKKLDGTQDPYECFNSYHNKNRERSLKYRCDGKCKRAKKFVQMLKEPKI